MNIITKVLHDFVDIPPNHFVFDIETTGLSSRFHNVILIGILFNHDNKTIIKQYFAENKSDEKNLLLAFAKDISIYDNHITFNGHTFDIPFLNSRFNKYNINFSLDKSNDIDILRLIKPYKEKLSLSDCKLKTIEKYLKINREDTISGKESVDMYKEFEKNQDVELKKKILLHNYEDIYYLGKIFKIKEILESKLDLIKIDNHETSLKLIPMSYKFASNKLTMKYNIFSDKIYDINIYNENYTILSKENIISLSININKGYDANQNTILFYKLSKIIPLKVNDSSLENNIYSLCNFIIKKELKSL